MPERSQPYDNRLLASLDGEDLRRLQPQMERVTFERGETVRIKTHAFFPTTCLASLMQATESGNCVESALVGKEGMLGACLFMSGSNGAGHVVALVPGEAFRIRGELLREEFHRASSTMRVLLCYTEALLFQASQHAVCCRYHQILQRMAFGLLQQTDCAPGHPVAITQELMAMRLGVRREGVTDAAGRLQKAGLIRYARGQVEILDRAGLEEMACECYGALQGEYQRLLPVPAWEICRLAA